MPGVPLGARREMIEDYAGMCSGVKWSEVKILTSDGHLLGGATAQVTVNNLPTKEVGKIAAQEAVGQTRKPPYRRRVVIVYFQGLVLISRSTSYQPKYPMGLFLESCYEPFTR